MTDDASTTAAAADPLEGLTPTPLPKILRDFAEQFLDFAKMAEMLEADGKLADSHNAVGVSRPEQRRDPARRNGARSRQGLARDSRWARRSRGRCQSARGDGAQGPLAERAAEVSHWIATLANGTEVAVEFALCDLGSGDGVIDVDSGTRCDRALHGDGDLAQAATAIHRRRGSHVVEWRVKGSPSRAQLHAALEAARPLLESYSGPKDPSQAVALVRAALVNP